MILAQVEGNPPRNNPHFCRQKYSTLVSSEAHSTGLCDVSLYTESLQVTSPSRVQAFWAYCGAILCMNSTRDGDEVMAIASALIALT